MGLEAAAVRPSVCQSVGEKGQRGWMIFRLIARMSLTNCRARLFRFDVASSCLDSKHVSAQAAILLRCFAKTRTHASRVHGYTHNEALCIRRTLCRHVTIGTPMVIFAVSIVF